MRKILRICGVCAFAMYVSPDVRAKDALQTLGTGIQFFLPLSALGLTLSKGDKEGTRRFLWVAAATTGTTQALKFLFHEKRPDGGHRSFPSGHTSISFASSVFMWLRYGPRYGVPSTILASLVGYSRIESRRHFLHDVAFGAFLGTLANLMLTPSLRVKASSTQLALQYHIRF